MPRPCRLTPAATWLAEALLTAYWVTASLSLMREYGYPLFGAAVVPAGACLDLTYLSINVLALGGAAWVFSFGHTTLVRLPPV